MTILVIHSRQTQKVRRLSGALLLNLSFLFFFSFLSRFFIFGLFLLSSFPLPRFSCPDGSVFIMANTSCVNENECLLWNPCYNGGTCEDLPPEEGRYKCSFVVKESTIVPSQSFVVAFVICFILFLLRKFFFLRICL